MVVNIHNHSSMHTELTSAEDVRSSIKLEPQCHRVSANMPDPSGIDAPIVTIDGIGDIRTDFLGVLSEIRITELGFVPPKLLVNVGDTLRFFNDTKFPKTIVFDNYYPQVVVAPIQYVDVPILDAGPIGFVSNTPSVPGGGIDVKHRILYPTVPVLPAKPCCPKSQSKYTVYITNNGTSNKILTGPNGVTSDSVAEIGFSVAGTGNLNIVGTFNDIETTKPIVFNKLGTLDLTPLATVAITPTWQSFIAYIPPNCAAVQFVTSVTSGPTITVIHASFRNTR